MKEKLQKLLQAKQEQRSNLNKAMIESESKEERMALGETLSKLGEEIVELEEMLKEVDEPAEIESGTGVELKDHCRNAAVGVGENGAENRAAICEGLEYMGVKLCDQRNHERADEHLISTDDSKVKVFVIATNEELMIARDTKAIVEAK